MSPTKADFLVDYLPEGSLSVAFPYDPTAVNLIRTVTGRRWHKEKRIWVIPRTGLRPLQQQAAIHGYGVALSERVRQALNLGKERQAQLATAKANESPFSLPTTTQPHPFQYAGIRFAKYALHNFRGALIADDMGLGKTFQALSLVAMHEKLASVLVICPNTLKYTWASEVEKHYPELTYTVIAGNAPKRQELWATESQLKIVNYEALIRDMEPRLVVWDLIIADEAGAFIKSYKAQRTKTVKKLHRRYSLALSGTPLENNLDELHSVMDFVIPGLLGPGWLFHQQHAVKDPYGVIRGWRGINEVRERIGPYYIRRTKKQVLPELPDKVYNDVQLEMTPAEWNLYDAIREQIKEKIAENPKLSVPNILVEILRLKQATCDARLLTDEHIPSTKMEAIGDLLTAAGEHKVVLFTQFSQLARFIQQDIDCPIIDGNVPPEERQSIINNFQGEKYACLVSTDAGAYGITLTAADIIVHIDAGWNPAKMRQREDRLHRIGQKNSVQVINLICRRTVDEKVRQIIFKKLDLVKAVLDENAPEEDASHIERSDLFRLLED